MAEEEHGGDERPRPRYGELAPEGWSWTPPDAHAQPAAPPEAPAERPRTAPPWDRPIALLLLILGILGMFLNIAVLTTAPDAIATLYARENLGSYTPASSVAGIVLAGAITQVLLYLATAALSILLLVRRRRAFAIPLIAGVVAGIVNVAFVTAIVATDPALVRFYGAG